MNRGQLTANRNRLSLSGEEIASSFSSESPESRWNEEMLSRLVAGAEAESGALWVPADSGDRFVPAFVVGLDYWAGKAADGQTAPKGVTAAASRQEVVCERAPKECIEDKRPLQHELFVPLVIEGSTRAVIHLIWDVDKLTTIPEDLQAFLDKVCPPARIADQSLLPQPVSDAKIVRQLLQAELPSTASTEADLFVMLHQSLNLKEVLSVAVNDGRRWLNCDRLSVAITKGDHTTIRAMSGQEEVNPRGNHIRLLANLAELVLTSQVRLVYTGDNTRRPPTIEESLAEYLHEGRSRMLAILPLTVPGPLVNFQDEHSQAIRNRELTAPGVLGALIVEQVTEASPRATEKQMELLAKHLAAAVYNARTYESVFLLPLLRWIGRELRRLRGRRLAKFAAIVGTLVITVAALCLVPWEYRVEGKGHLMPAIRYNAYAPVDGEIVELLVHGGERVAQDQVLLRMRNDELQIQLLNAQNELHEKETLVNSVKAELDSAEAAADRQAEIRAHAKLVQARIERDGLKSQTEMLERQLAKLTIRAPNAGVVATFRIDQLLTHRPVRRGDLLVEVMEVDGPWRLELEVPEHRLGHLARAVASSAVESSGSGTIKPAGPLVDFVLATATDRKWLAHLDQVAARSNLSETEGDIVEVTAALAADQVPDRRIGADVTARIHCGPSKLGYVLFGDVVEFVRRRIWW